MQAGSAGRTQVAPCKLFSAHMALGFVPPPSCSSLSPVLAALTSASLILNSHASPCSAGGHPPAQDTHYLAESLS